MKLLKLDDDTVVRYDDSGDIAEAASLTPPEREAAIVFMRLGLGDELTDGILAREDRPAPLYVAQAKAFFRSDALRRGIFKLAIIAASKNLT